MATTARPDLSSAGTRPVEIRSVRIGAGDSPCLRGRPARAAEAGRRASCGLGVASLAGRRTPRQRPPGRRGAGEPLPRARPARPLSLCLRSRTGPGRSHRACGRDEPQELKGRTTVSRGHLESRQIAISVMAAGLVFSALRWGSKDWPAYLLIAEVALVADAGVNYLLVALIYALGSKQRDLGSASHPLHRHASVLRGLLSGPRTRRGDDGGALRAHWQSGLARLPHPGRLRHGDTEANDLCIWGTPGLGCTPRGTPVR